MPDPTPVLLDPDAPASASFVSGQRHPVRIRRRVWTPLVTYMEGHNVVNAYNLGLLAQLAYEGDTGALASDVVDTVAGLTTVTPRDAVAVGKLVGEPVMKRVDVADALNPEALLFMNSDATETQGFAVAGGEHALVAFRGTEPSKLSDWLRDAAFEGARCPWGRSGGEVHLGFLNGFLSVRDALDGFLDENWVAGTPIVLCGHSLGGALATVAATYLRETRTDRVMLYTYGSPRTGSVRFSRYYTTQRPIVAHCHVLHADIVARVPVPGQELNATGVVGAVTRVLPALLLVDVDLDPWEHVGVVQYYEHFETGDVAQSVLTRPAGAPEAAPGLGWEAPPLQTYREAIDQAVRDAARYGPAGPTVTVLRSAGNQLSHLFTDHFMADGYIPVLQHQMRAGIRGFLARTAPTASLEARAATARAGMAECDRRIRAIRERQALNRLQAIQLRFDAETRRSMVVPRDNLLLPPIPGFPAPPARSAPEAEALARAEALEHEVAQWEQTVRTIEGLKEALRAQAREPYGPQGHLAGYEPVEGLREELERHVD